MLRVILAAWLITAAACATGANTAPISTVVYGKDVSAEKVGGQLDMTDQDGRRRRLSDFHGKVVLIFFGYTRCPDVCPTTLLRMARVMTLLGPEADKVQVLWVTVDPKRDTAEILRNYVPAFNPRFIALRNSPEKTLALARKFKVSFSILNYQGTILVDHSAYGYLIDPSGQTRLKLSYDMTAEQIAADVRGFIARNQVWPLPHPAAR